MQALTKVDISEESRIVANIVSDTKLLDQCISIIDPTLFESPITQVIVEWSTDYYKRLNEAPGANLKDVFISRRSELKDADADLVYTYMKKGDWKPCDNLDFAKKQLTDYIQLRSMKRLVDRLNAKIESGNVKDCENAIAEYSKPEVRQSNVVNLFTDVKKITDVANKEEEDILFQFAGDLGATCGSFVQSDFGLWIAPPKRGKTWWLMHTALQAALQGNKVLYISLEMTEDETVERFVRMMSGKARRYGKTHLVKFVDMENGQWEQVEGEVELPVMNTSSIAVGKMLATLRKYSNNGDLKIITKPTNSFSIDDLRKELNTLETFEHFVPTVVVIDYMDIMKYKAFGDAKRFGLDNLYLEARGLNMERKFCLISASQGGMGFVTGEQDISEADIAECKSKLAHATKMLLINQTPDEKKRGLYRINVNLARNGGVSFETCVVSCCLDIGRPVMDSHRLSTIYDPKKEKDASKELNNAGFGGRKKNSYDE